MYSGYLTVSLSNSRLTSAGHCGTSLATSAISCDTSGSSVKIRPKKENRNTVNTSHTATTRRTRR